MGLRVSVLVLVAGFAAGCISDADVRDDALPSPNPTQPSGPFTLTSTAFAPGEPIPPEHACPTNPTAPRTETNPQLLFANPPPGALTFALIMDDPDAPSGTVLHWTFWDLPIERLEIPSGADMADLGATVGQAYRGPCPPDGEHRYFFHAYAVDGVLGLDAGSTRDQLETALAAHNTTAAELMGTYNRLPIDPPA